MNIYTYSQARQNLKRVIEQSLKDGKVLIKRKDGSVFELRPVARDESPLDVKGIDVRIHKDEIIEAIRETRRR